MSMSDATVFEADSFGQLVLVEADPGRQEVKRAVAGFPAGYRGQTMTAYRIDLNKFIAWLDAARVAVFDAERAHIELYARWSETQGLAPATIGRRLSTIAASAPSAPKNASLTATPPRTCVVRSRTTSPRPGWIATNSAGSSSKPACVVVGITRWRACWR
jgi:hypothetical protein